MRKRCDVLSPAFKGNIINLISLCVGVADVLEHLHAARSDVDFVCLHTQRFHQAQCIQAGFFTRREAGHSVGKNMGAGAREKIHRPGGDNQSVRGVESAGYADHYRVDP
jgi:hypothetical protein